MKNFKFIKVIMLLLLASVLMASSCNDKIDNSADAMQAKQTAQALKQANDQIGMPAIVNFTQKKDYKEILEILDQADMITHTYLASTLHGTVGEYLGQSIGYGIPAATQYTNPTKIIDDPYRYQSGGKVVPQADPNGLFMPTATSATWIKLINPETGIPEVVFIEPLIIVSPFKLH